MTAPQGVFVHPRGLCESEDVGAGTRIWAFAHVLAGAVVGRHCNVCDHAFIEGGARIGDRVTVKNAVLVWDGVTVEDDVFLGPNVVFTNDLRPRAHVKKSREELLPTLVRRGATLGAGVTVVCGTTIGEHAFVAAGAVVTADVPERAFVAGNPARQSGWVCECGTRLRCGGGCPVCDGTSAVQAEQAGLAGDRCDSLDSESETSGQPDAGALTNHFRTLSSS